MVAHFLENELRVWLDIDGSEYFPALYSFKLEGNKVYLYMELLDNSKYCHCLTLILPMRNNAKKRRKMTETLANGYSSESTQ